MIMSIHIVLIKYDAEKLRMSIPSRHLRLWLTTSKHGDFPLQIPLSDLNMVQFIMVRGGSHNYSWQS